MKLNVFSAAVAACLVSVPFVDAASAAVVASFDGPTDSSIGIAGTRNRVGQTFTPTASGGLASIDLTLRLNAAQPATLFVNVFATGTNGLPTGDSLATSIVPVTLGEAFSPVRFDFTGGPELSAGVQYAYVLNSADGDGGFLLATTRGNTYAGGRGIIGINNAALGFMGSNFIYGERDTLFAVTVPEPASAGLLAGTGLLLLARRR